MEEELEFKGIEEEEEEESLVDTERNSADGDKDKGEEMFCAFLHTGAIYYRSISLIVFSPPHRE